MKLNLKRINEIESIYGVKSLFNIRKENQYLYVKIRKQYEKMIISLPVNTLGKKVRYMPFIALADLDVIKTKKKEAKRLMKRSFMGRPYSFCKNCDMKENCSMDYPCEPRDKYLAQKELAKTVEGDERYWKNGVPRKKLVLCQSAKYMYAHKKTAGQCQEDKCAFYVNGRCELGLDKEPKGVL